MYGGWHAAWRLLSVQEREFIMFMIGFLQFCEVFPFLLLLQQQHKRILAQLKVIASGMFSASLRLLLRKTDTHRLPTGGAGLESLPAVHSDAFEGLRSCRNVTQEKEVP